MNKAEVLGLSGLIGLSIPEEMQAKVVENLNRIQQVAQLVNAVELGPEDELGPEWKP